MSHQAFTVFCLNAKESWISDIINLSQTSKLVRQAVLSVVQAKRVKVKSQESEIHSPGDPTTVTYLTQTSCPKEVFITGSCGQIICFWVGLWKSKTMSSMFVRVCEIVVAEVSISQRIEFTPLSRRQDLKFRITDQKSQGSFLEAEDLLTIGLGIKLRMFGLSPTELLPMPETMRSAEIFMMSKMVSKPQRDKNLTMGNFLLFFSHWVVRSEGEARDLSEVLTKFREMNGVTITMRLLIRRALMAFPEYHLEINKIRCREGSDWDVTGQSLDEEEILWNS